MVLETSKTLGIENAELHRHIEGSVKVSTLVEIFKAYAHHGVSLRPETIAAMHEYDNQAIAALKFKKNRNSINFFKAFKTRWIQFLCVKLMVENKSGSQQRSKSLEWDFLSRVHEHEFRQALNPSPFGEDIFELNHLVSLTNISEDLLHRGLDLRDRASSIPEENETYAKWNTLTAKQKKGYNLSLPDLIRMVGTTRDKVLSEKKFHPQSHINITLSFRRDLDYKLLTNPEKMKSLVAQLKPLFAQGYFDLVDICGNESDKRYPLALYLPFLQELEEAGIEYTLHLMENPYGKRAISRENAVAAFSIASKPVLAAHVTRGMDLNSNGEPAMRETLDEMVKHGVILGLPPRSNDLSGIVLDLDRHRLIENMLTQKVFRPYLKQLIWVICTDDPGVFSSEDTQALAEEIQMFLDAVKKMRDRNENVIPQWELLQLLEQNINIAVNRMRTKVTEARKILRLREPELLHVDHTVFVPEQFAPAVVREELRFARINS